MADSVLVNGDTSINKTDKNPCPFGNLLSSKERQTINKINKIHSILEGYKLVKQDEGRRQDVILNGVAR